MPKPYTNYYLIKIPDLNRASKSEQSTYFFILKEHMVLMYSSQGLKKGSNSKKPWHIFDYSIKKWFLVFFMNYCSLVLMKIGCFWVSKPQFSKKNK